LADAVHIILLIAFWVVVIMAAHQKPWWLPIPAGAVAAFLFGIVNLALAGGRAEPLGALFAAIGGAFCGLIVIGVRAVMRKIRRDPFEAKPETTKPMEWPRIKGWQKPDEGHGPEV
jgi:membrane associated rhomboid family serine protease